MITKNQLYRTFATLTSTALLCGVTALAQTGGGSGGGMQQGAPTAQPGTSQPGANPMDRTSVDPNAPLTGNGETSPMDKVFVDNALKGGMAEVQLGQLALQKSTNPDVKQFAQKMVDDHTRMGDQMKPIAQQIGVKVPDKISGKDKSTIAKLSALNGDAFDKAYIKDMVKDHKDDLNDFQSEAQNGSNPAVKNAANQGSQIINQHLHMIQQISQKSSANPTTGGMN